LVTLLCSCVTKDWYESYTPTHNTAQPLDVQAARKTVAQGIMHGPHEILSLGSNILSTNQYVFIDSVHLISNDLIIIVKTGKAVVLPLMDLQIKANILMKDVNVKANEAEATSTIELSGFVILIEKGPTARQIADALFALKQAALSRNSNEAANSAHFAEVAKAYRETTSRPVLSEEVHRFRIQAEGAVLDKKFYDAVDLYEQALEVAPWWPEGHFNRALVLGEIKEYDLAIIEMKRYLLLVPNAPNAREVQDRIYDWERKTGIQN